MTTTRQAQKVLLVFGTRPEAIKLAPLVLAMRAAPEAFRPVVCVTGQHREMLRQILDIFAIRPDHDLDIMRPDQDLFDISARVMTGLRDVLRAVAPDIVLVQGDTSTAFLAALGAFYLRIPIGHVEAGLRTWNKLSPFPEEANRHMLSAVADHHFCPTEWARQNLLRENVPADAISVTGNTVVDALLVTSRRLDEPETSRRLDELLAREHGVDLGADARRVILVTGHRRENFGGGFESICRALARIGDARPDVRVVYPVHLNPNVRRPVLSILAGRPNVTLTEPMGYEPFIHLMRRAHFVLTDSGGVQEEAPTFGKPVLVMRDTTERPEGVDAGNVRLVGCDEEAIVRESLELLDSPEAHARMARVSNPYGDGRACGRILDVLAARS